MRKHLFLQPFALAVLVAIGGVQTSTQSAAPQMVAAERVGFSSESLKDLDTGMQGLVDNKHLAGIVTLVARHGKVVQHKAYGVQDLESQKPMQLDTIARIFSMTKPIA